MSIDIPHEHVHATGKQDSDLHRRSTIATPSHIPLLLLSLACLMQMREMAVEIPYHFATLLITLPGGGSGENASQNGSDLTNLSCSLL